MHRLHICCAMRANGSFAAIRGNAEFFTCGMRKSDKGQFAERSALDFPQLPIDNFPHSALRKLLAASYLVPSLFAPGPIRSLALSLGGHFVPWNFRCLALSLPKMAGPTPVCRYRHVGLAPFERKFPGHFAQGSESSREREGQGARGPGTT